MKSFTVAALTALWAQNVAAHATFQQLWVDGVDFGSQCARLPNSNNPISSVTSNDIRCNVYGTRPGVKCPVKAGSTVTVEMHQVGLPCPLLHMDISTSPQMAPLPNIMSLAKR